MTQPRFRPRYAIKGQGLEDLYDVVDYSEGPGFVVSDAPKPHAEAAADARTRNAFADARKLDETVSRLFRDGGAYYVFTPSPSRLIEFCGGINFDDAIAEDASVFVPLSKATPQ